MNVLSLFDGMSCAQIALERAGIKVDNYFASEIDKYAIKVTQANYPNTIQLGDITNWKMFLWEHLPKIDLIIAGSPCQGFSVAGRGGNFDDVRSRLFFTFVDILKYHKPKYFLLENVKMKKEWRDVITELVGVEPIEINSSLVSAQNRVRLYWTNIPNVTIPDDKGILLKDIIETGEVDRDKSYCVDANYFKGGSLRMYTEKKKKRQLVFRQSEKRLMVKQCIQVGEAEDIKGHGYNRRVYSTDGKAPTLATHSGGNLEPKITQDEYTWRKLTPLECERLQCVDDNYTNHVSNSQRYKMLGNGFTVDVVAHILSFIPKENLYEYS